MAHASGYVVGHATGHASCLCHGPCPRKPWAMSLVMSRAMGHATGHEMDHTMAHAMAHGLEMSCINYQEMLTYSEIAIHEELVGIFGIIGINQLMSNSLLRYQTIDINLVEDS